MGNLAKRLDKGLLALSFAFAAFAASGATVKVPLKAGCF